MQYIIVENGIASKRKKQKQVWRVFLQQLVDGIAEKKTKQKNKICLIEW